MSAASAGGRASGRKGKGDEAISLATPSELRLFEGRPDGWVLEAGNDIAGKHAQVGAEIPVRPAW
jgi:hypothetical protein